MKKSKEIVIVASKEVGLEVNTEEIKYMSLSRRHNARKTWSPTLGEKHKLRVFENRVLRRMY
jgi:hypothetical protein